MNKKKISIVAVSAVVIVALGLGFNSIFKKANTLETVKNDTVAAEQLVEKNDELNTEETKVDDVQTEKDNKENKASKEKKENKEDKEDKNKKNTTESSKDSDVKDSELTKTSKEEAKKQDKNETTKTNDDEVKKTENSEKPKQENTAKPKPVKTEKPKPDNTQKPKLENNENTKPNTKTVKIAISCKTAINSGVNKKPGFTHLPSNGIILQDMEVEFKEGDTVFDILLRATRKKGIHMEYSGGGSNIYIEGINNLYEFDGGPQSGWMYSVNGIYPNYGVGGYKVKSSDVIRFNYTCNLGADLGVKAN